MQSAKADFVLLQPGFPTRCFEPRDERLDEITIASLVYQ